MSKNRPKIWYDDEHNYYAYRSEARSYYWRSNLIVPDPRKHCKHFENIVVGEPISVKFANGFYVGYYVFPDRAITGIVKRIDLNYGEEPQQILIEVGGTILHVDFSRGDRIIES